MISEVFSQQKPHVITNWHFNEIKARFNPALKKIAQIENWRSLIILPMLIKRDVPGVLICGKTSTHHFSSTEISNLEDFANIASLDHYNARQFHKWEMIEQKNQLLVRDNLESTMNIISANILEVAEAGGATMGYFEASKQTFEPHLSRTVGNFGTNLIDWYDLSDV